MSWEALAGTSGAEGCRQTRKAELRSVLKRPSIGIASLLLSP